MPQRASLEPSDGYRGGRRGTDVCTYVEVTLQLPAVVNRLALRVSVLTRDRTPLSRTRIVLAAKAALAALLAWYLVTILIHDVTYPYYAPLGAMLAMGFSVSASMRESARAIGAIVLGLAIAVACDYTLGTTALGVALVIGVGVVVAGWRRLGTEGSWVPTSALFVLILAGDSNVVEYVGSYGGLTLLGMVIGLAVNVLFPAHPLARFDAFANGLRRRLADQLDALADGLGDGEASPSAQDWEERRHDMLPMIAEVRAITQETADSSRGNPRARWYQGRADTQYAHAQLLERITFLTEELTQLISEGERSENHTLALGTELRGPTGRTLRGIAGVFRQSETADPADGRRAIAEAHRELRALEAGIQSIGRYQETLLFHAGGIATELRRTLQTAAVLVCE